MMRSEERTEGVLHAHWYYHVSRVTPTITLQLGYLQLLLVSEVGGEEEMKMMDTFTLHCNYESSTQQTFHSVPEDRPEN